MGIYNKHTQQPIVLAENREADDLARSAHANFQAEHADDVRVAALFDDEGVQVNFVGRTEVATVEAPTYSITTFSDGTVRRDLRLPPAEKPAPVTADSQYSFSQADQQRLSAHGVAKVHAGSGQGEPIPPALPKQDAMRLLHDPRRGEFGDSFKRP